MYCKLHQLIGFTVSGGHLSLVVRYCITHHMVPFHDLCSYIGCSICFCSPLCGLLLALVLKSMSWL
uniref:Uncharacterized protein n=1 Tax=Anguilla anguilla TaxID=7936 RepID=A0A0E9PXK1_ANGAN